MHWSELEEEEKADEVVEGQEDEEVVEEDDEKKDTRLDFLLHSPQDVTARISEAAARLANSQTARDPRWGGTPHHCFSFVPFGALGAAYEPEIRAALRDFDPDVETRLCVDRNLFKHAIGVILHAYHRAMTNPAYAMCRRRLAKLFSDVQP